MTTTETPRPVAYIITDAQREMLDTLRKRIEAGDLDGAQEATAIVEGLTRAKRDERR